MLNGVTMKINVDDYIINTLKEDITSEDVSTNAVMPEDKQGRADLICKQDGLVCGLDVFERTFKILDDTSRFEANFKDGDFVKKGDLIGVIYGDVKAILSGERTALNYLQRMSGIATMTREYVNEVIIEAQKEFHFSDCCELMDYVCDTYDFKWEDFSYDISFDMNV